MLKTVYKVKSPKLSLILSRGEENERVLFKRGDVFEAFPYEIPLSFSDLVESLGPAEPSPDVSFEEEKDVEEETEEKEEVPKPVRKKEAIRKSVDPPVARRVVKKK